MLSRIKPALVGFVLLFAGFGFTIYRVETNISNSAHSRVTTVAQRCELTELTLDEAKTSDVRVKLTKSLKGCRAQLVKVKKEAGG